MGLPTKIISKLFFFLLGGVITPLFPLAITLINDSAYPLNAQIIDANGEHLALIHLIEGQMYIYDIPEGSFDESPNQAYTPLTVIFLCESARPYDYSTPPAKGSKNEQKKNTSEYVEQFGIWTGVPRSATVTALGAPAGSKSCIMKKNPKIKGFSKSSRLETNGTNRWSNDGGSTWTNDGGSPKSPCEYGGCSQNESRLSGANDADTPLNKNETTFTDEDGDVITKPSSEEEKKQEHSSWTEDGGKTWKSTQSDSTTHTPTKNTPLPFQQR